MHAASTTTAATTDRSETVSDTTPYEGPVAGHASLAGDTAHGAGSPTSSAMSALVSALEDTDPACLDIDDLDRVRAQFQRVIGWAQSGVLACTRRQGELAASGQAEDPALSLLHTGGQSAAEAASTVDQAALCETHAELGNSLAAGEITTTYLASIARERRRLNDAERCEFDSRIDEIHGWARNHTVSSFERRLKRLVKTIRQIVGGESDTAELERQRRDSHIKQWVDRQSGLHHHLLVMDPIRAAKFSSALRAELAALRNKNQRTVRGSSDGHSEAPPEHRSYGSLQIDALINAITGGVAASRASELIVHVDHDTLVTAPHDHTICETTDGDPVPVSVARSMVGEAALSVMFKNADNNVVRAIDERTANRPQRRALAAMYRTCSWQECDVPFSDTRMHHVLYYRNGGPTQLHNLLPLCERHHHRIHDEGWQLRLDPDTRAATFHPPNNPNRSTITTPDRAPPRQ